MHSALPKLFPAASHPNGRRKLTRIVGWFAFFCMMGTGSTPAGAQWYGQLGYNALEQDRTFYFRADWQMGANRSISDIDWVTELMQYARARGHSRIEPQEGAERDWVDGYLSFKGRIERDDWVRQAKALAKGGVDEYVRVFGKKPR